MRLIDIDYLSLELDVNHCHVDVKWLRQVSSQECQRGLEVALTAALELKTALQQTRALVQA